MKTSTLIVLCSSFASVIVAAEPPTPPQMHLIDREPPRSLQMHFIDRTPIQTNAPYRVSVAYDVIRREAASTPSIRLPSRP